MDHILHSMTHQSLVVSRHPTSNYTVRNNVLTSQTAIYPTLILYVTRGILPQRITDYSVQIGSVLRTLTECFKLRKRIVHAKTIKEHLLVYHKSIKRSLMHGYETHKVE
jgi:hypothetical protein